MGDKQSWKTHPSKANGLLVKTLWPEEQLVVALVDEIAALVIISFVGVVA